MMVEAFRNLWSLLAPPERRFFVVLVGMTSLAGLVDAVGIASILPFLALVANPDMATQNPVLRALSDALGNPEPSGLLIATGLLALAAVLTGLAARAAAFYALTRFVRMRELSLGLRLFRKYLSQPYVWFLGRNSADLGKSLLSEVTQVVLGPFDAAIRLIAHCAIALFIVLLLVIIQPLAALAAAALLVSSYLVISRLLLRRMPSLGRERIKANRRRFEITNEALGGIKDVKILNLEKRYLERFRVPTRRYAEVQARAALTSELPRYVLEGIAFAGMILFVIGLLARSGGALEAALPVLGAYAFAGVRLFPAMQDIFKATTRLRFGAPALAALCDDLKEPAKVPRAVPEEPPLTLTKSLVLDDVTFRYPDAQRAAVVGLTLRIEAGSVVGIVGPTGAGKSTVTDIVLGLLEPQSGEMRVDGVAVAGDAMLRWRRSVGYVQQTSFLTDDTIAANIAFGETEEEMDREAVRRAARLAQIDGAIEALPNGYDTRIGERGGRLSGGQRQRICIARALYRDPSVIVLDEATSALDNLTEAAVMDMIRGLGRSKTVIVIAHRLSTVRGSDTIFLLEEGRLRASGRYDELIEQSDTFRRIHEAGV